MYASFWFSPSLWCQPCPTPQSSRLDHVAVIHHLWGKTRWMSHELEHRVGAQVPGLQSGASNGEEEEGELQQDSASSSASSSVASPAPKVIM